MDSASPLSAETLLEHREFVQAVARGLLGRTQGADDVAQETWLRALTHGPRAPGALRAWLGSVVRNLAHDERRGSARRATREQVAARPEALESVTSAFERLSVQRDVVSAILELVEPYRSVVLLRYYHDLEPAAIAERLGAKPATVRTQLVRAHELLRAKLDARYRRETWAALLLPGAALAKKGAGSTAAALAVGALAVSAALWFTLQRGVSRSPGTESLVPAAGSIASSRAPALLSAPSAEPARTASTTSAAQPAPEPEAPAQGPAQVKERLFARAELLDRRQYDDYEKATFSFEYGLRDDPEHVTQNDRDLQFSQGNFYTDVGDISLIVDLGRVTLAQLGNTPIEPLLDKVAAAARAKFDPASQDRRSTCELQACEGRTYFLWTRDSNTNQAAAFEVLTYEPRDRCTLEWYATSDGRTARGSVASPPGMRSLTDTLLRLRAHAAAQRFLASPRIVLQVRAGAGGGNANRLDMAGGTTVYVDRVVDHPLEIMTPVDMHEDSLAYSESGFVPANRKLVVTRVTYAGTANGDSNGHGEFKLVLGGLELAHVKDSTAPISSTWQGRAVIAPGEEEKTYLEIANSSSGEAIFEGHWEPAETR